MLLELNRMNLEGAKSFTDGFLEEGTLVDNS